MFFKCYSVNVYLEMLRKPVMYILSALNPEAFWPLNYNTTTSDVSQNSLHLTQVGSLVYDDGGVIFMDDPGQVLYLDTILGPPLSLDEAFSVVFWVKAHDDGVLLEWVNRLGFTVISLG